MLGQYAQCQTQAIRIPLRLLLPRINFFPSTAHVEDNVEGEMLWPDCFKNDHTGLQV